MSTTLGLVSCFVLELSIQNSHGLISILPTSISLRVSLMMVKQRWSARKSAKVYPFIAFCGMYYILNLNKVIIILPIFPLMIFHDNIYLIRVIM